MNDPVIIGVDPGKKGGIAAVYLDGRLAWVEDMPDLSGVALAAALQDMLQNENVTEARVERVHSMPKQGVASTWTFAEGYGVILGTLGAMRIRTTLVSPQVWKKVYGLTADKDQSRQQAIQRWPSHVARFALKKNDGRAEAALIAAHALT